MTLIEKLKAAAGLDRYLDALIEVEARRLSAYAVGLNDNTRAHWNATIDGDVYVSATSYQSPPYTASIDAALALVEKMFDPEPSANHPIEMTLTSTGNKGPWRCAIWVGNDNSDGLYSEAKTAPLAILIALLSTLSGDKQ